MAKCNSSLDAGSNTERWGRGRKMSTDRIATEIQQRKSLPTTSGTPEGCVTEPTGVSRQTS